MFLRSRLRVIKAGTSLLALTAVASCALLIGIDEDRPVIDPATSPDGAGSPDTAPPPSLPEASCRGRFTDPLPPLDGGDGGDAADAGRSALDGSFTVALQSFAAFAPSRANLDDRETDGGDTSSCRLSPSAPVQAPAWIDLPGGADNAAALLFAVFSGPDTPLRPERIQGQVDRGQLAIAFQVTDYNGQDDDDQVSVRFIPLRGLAPNVFSDGGTSIIVLRQGDRRDVWVADEEYNSGGFTRFTTADARVERGVLSATFREVAYKLAFFGSDVSPPLRVRLHDVLLRARIVLAPSGEPRLTQGEFAGRWRLDDLLDSMGGLIMPSGQAFCANAGFDVIRGACKIADLAASATDDVCSAAAAVERAPQPCGAVSTFQTFDTYPIDFPAARHLLPSADAGCPLERRRCP